MKTIPILTQNVEHNVSKTAIAELVGSDGFSLMVRNIFYTIQGEGPYAGIPAIFIRLAGCNRGAKIDCNWCDTDFLIERSKVMDVEAILKVVKSWGHELSLDKPLVVLTGGEPLLHNTEMLNRMLHEAGYLVQVETNGDLVRFATMPRAHIVVSPKVSARSGRYTKPHREMLERADSLKFVVSSDPNSPYHTLPEYVYDFADRKGSYNVFISPVNEYARPLRQGEVASMWGDMYDHARCQANYKHAAALVMEKAFRLSLQTHLFAEVE